MIGLNKENIVGLYLSLFQESDAILLRELTNILKKKFESLWFLKLPYVINVFLNFQHY